MSKKMVQLKKVNFEHSSEFYKVLTLKVNNYFREHNLSKYGNHEMVLKTIVLFIIFLTPYVLLFTSILQGFWAVLLLFAIIGIGKATIGLSVMHDANHNSYSKNKIVNRIMSYTMNLLGGHSVLWRIQHNVLHHTYTNIEGLDEDIAPAAILRFSPHARYRWIHRFQHIYSWFLYGLMTLSWSVQKDFTSLVKYKKLSLFKSQKTTFEKELASLIITKSMYFGYILVLPLLFSPFLWWQILIGFILMDYIAGFILAIIFQPAHVMDACDFPVSNDDGKMESSWAIHQLLTTANFAPRSKIFTWFVGGLNFQIEHHLFPNICHIHYKKISKIVKKTTEEFGLPYYSHPTFMHALWEHARMLYKLGRPTASPVMIR